MDGRSNNTSHYGKMCPHWTRREAAGAGLEPPSLRFVLVSLRGDIWWHLMNPASRFHTFYTVSASVGWPRLELQTCKLGTACARKSRGTSSEWTEAAGATVGKEKRGDPAREQRKRHAPSKRGVWSQEGDAQLGRPVRSLPRAQVRPSSGLGHAQH